MGDCHRIWVSAPDALAQEMASLLWACQMKAPAGLRYVGGSIVYR